MAVQDGRFHWKTSICFSCLRFFQLCLAVIFEPTFFIPHRDESRSGSEMKYAKNVFLVAVSNARLEGSTMKAISVWSDGYKNFLDDGRGHSVVVDLPTDQGGGNAGPTALELCVMSLAGCITTIFKVVAEKRHFVYKAFKVELEAEKTEEALTVTGVKGKMEIVTDASEKEAETVLRLTTTTCPVSVIFKNAGIKFEWTLTVKRLRQGQDPNPLV